MGMTYDDIARAAGMPTEGERLAAEEAAYAAALTLNEARAALGLDPLPGGDNTPKVCPQCGRAGFRSEGGVVLGLACECDGSLRMDIPHVVGGA